MPRRIEEPTEPEFWLDSLAPIRLPAPSRKGAKKADTGCTLIGSDFHFHPDTADPAACEIFLQVAKDLNPGTIVLNGDLADLMAVSRYPKDVRIPLALAEERRLMHEFLYELREVAPRARLVETNANHSGDGHESRWWRYLNERIPEVLTALPELQESLSYKAVWHPEWLDMELVDYHEICPGFIALHGDVVRGRAGDSAKGMLEKWRISLVHGHTHRMAAIGYAVPAVAGKREHQMRAFEGGCLCQLKAPYLSVANWQQGFTIVRHDEEGHFGVEQVLIHDGVAVVVSLGGAYRASL